MKKVKFIHYYFLININDVPAIRESKILPTVPSLIRIFSKDYMVLHNMRRRLTILYLDNLLHVPPVGTRAGEVIV